MSVQFFCPFFNWVVRGFLMLSCMSCLYMLDINPLSVVSFANIFLHVGAFLSQQFSMDGSFKLNELQLLKFFFLWIFVFMLLCMPGNFFFSQIATG